VRNLAATIAAANIGPVHNANAANYALSWLMIARSCGNLPVDQMRAAINISDSTTNLTANQDFTLVQSILNAAKTAFNW
jgi:hypothetical protein